ncbi:hypothetical protein Hanom_Chr16g01422071 [Helianthus anomalus]
MRGSPWNLKHLCTKTRVFFYEYVLPSEYCYRLQNLCIPQHVLQKLHITCITIAS